MKGLLEVVLFAVLCNVGQSRRLSLDFGVEPKASTFFNISINEVKLGNNAAHLVNGYWTKWSHDKAAHGEVESAIQQCPPGQFITSMRFFDYSYHTYRYLTELSVRCSNSLQQPAPHWDDSMVCGNEGFMQITLRLGFLNYDNGPGPIMVNAKTVCGKSYHEMTVNDNNWGQDDSPLTCATGQKVIGFQLKTATDTFSVNPPTTERYISNMRIQCA